VGRQHEGIEGIDPVRHGMFAARRHVDTNGHDRDYHVFLLGTHLIFHIIEQMFNFNHECSVQSI